MTPSSRLTYASLVVADPGRSADFYASVLGLTPGPTTSPGTFRRLQSDGADLALSWPGVRDLQAMPPDTHTFLTFDPGTADAVGRTAELAQAAGGELVLAPQPTAYGTVVAVLRDPDHHVFRLEHRVRPLM